tara:strand:- start:254 stop:688 length:435 start_codon:yes stop_codon:yes gene_type:complete
MTLSRPTNFIKEYYKKNGKLSFTDEEVNKFSELMMAIYYRIINPKFDSGEDVAKRRISVCKKCPQFKISHNGGKQCNACGCDLDVKTTIATEWCPEKKWDMDIVSVRAKIKEAVDLMNETRDEDWYDMMSFEDYEEWQANEAAK